MVPQPENVVVVVAQLAVIVGLALVYLRVVDMPRAVAGVYTLRDIFVMLGLIVVLPLIYLRLPGIVLTVILVVVFSTVITYTVAPLLPRVVPVLVALALVGADVWMASTRADTSIGPGFLALNDLVVAIAAIGVSNLYAQNGMKSRDVAVFAFGLAIYDVIATAWLPIMLEFFTRLLSLPLLPALAWGGRTGGAAIGLGDVLLITLWSVVAAKAFGMRAALVSAATSLSCVVGIFVAMMNGVLDEIVPAMVFLGPLMVVQQVVFRWHYGRDRTMQEMRTSSAVRVAGDPARAELERALETRVALLDATADEYAATWRGEVVATAPTRWAVVHAARAARPDVVPVIVRLVPDTR
ncbi:MAG TPA: hypothetical protein VHJ34_03065 [Actinomycetota bacterium]|nr:hypothetical protein [Actinomycetota bacterium]